MKNPKYDLLLNALDDLDKEQREALTTMYMAEEVKHNTPLYQLVVMQGLGKFDGARLREIIPEASVADIRALVENPDDAAAFMRVYMSLRPETFVDDLRLLSMRGKVGDKMTVEVSVTLESGKTVTEKDDYFVTPGFVRSAKLIALDLYERIAAEHSNITKSQADISVG